MKFEISTYYYGNEFQKSLRKELKTILEEHSCSELLMPVFTCVNELVVNAVKANYKKIYFDKTGVDQNSHSEQYEAILEKFRYEFSSDKIKRLTKLAHKNHLKTFVEGYVDNQNLKVKVVNPHPVSLIEHENIQKKMSAARESVAMMSYFASEIDDKYKEGAGLGIIFIGIILKSLGLTIETLNIDCIDDKTIATLSIPLTKHVLDHFKMNSQVN